MMLRPGAPSGGRTKSGGSSRRTTAPKAGAATGASSLASRPPPSALTSASLSPTFPGSRAKHLYEERSTAPAAANGEPDQGALQALFAIRQNLMPSMGGEPVPPFSPHCRLLAHASAAKRYAKKSQWRNATFQAIRNTFIKIAARVEQMKTRIRVSFPTATPNIGVINIMLGKLAAQAP